MSKQKASFPSILLLTNVLISSGLLFSFLPNILCIKNEGMLYDIRPASVKQFPVPYRSPYGIGYNSDYNFKQKDHVYRQQPLVHGDNIFQIEASDAIDGMKYSQLDIGYHEKVPSSAFSKHKLLQTSAQNPSPPKFQEQNFPSLHTSEKNPLKLLNSMRDIRYLDSAGDQGISLGGSGDESRSENKKLENIVQSAGEDAETSNLYVETKNNFTDASENLDSVSSDAVLSYEVPSEFNDSSSKNASMKQRIEIVNDVPSHNNSDISPSTSLSSQTSNGFTTPNSDQLNTHVYIDYTNHTNLTDDIVSVSMFPSIFDKENDTNSLPSTDIEKKLSSGTVAGIVIAVLVSVTLLSSAVIYLLYRKFNGKCTSVVESKFNSDNCGYLDDSLRSSIYLNNHIELPKESSEEMTSLDNDSFLNSLETMTIQNYWADNSKNTKV